MRLSSLVVLASLVATASAADPLNPYAPTPGWTPPADIWSQPAPIQPAAPESACSPFNPYAGDCSSSPQPFVVNLVNLAPPPPDPWQLDDEIPAARLMVASADLGRSRSLAAEPQQRVPEPALVALVALGLGAQLSRRLRRR